MDMKMNAAIAERPPRSYAPWRFVLDRAEVLGPILLAPATLYILALVGVPFLLAVYYSLSAYTIYNPSYHFVGLRNFISHRAG